LPRFYGPIWPLGERKIPHQARHQPFTPRLPRIIRERPAIGAAGLAGIGIAASWMIVANMARWPTWTLFPSILVSVLALSATVIGMGLLSVLLLQPVLGTKAGGWGADPVAVLGLPVALQRKCESLGFWTCESMLESIENGRFPWTSLEYDERMQVQRALGLWNAHRAEHQEAVS
jgi:hypothetical protein